MRPRKSFSKEVTRKGNEYIYLAVEDTNAPVVGHTFNCKADENIRLLPWTTWKEEKHEV